MYRILPTLKSLLFAYIEIDNGVKLKTKLYNTLDDWRQVSLNPVHGEVTSDTTLSLSVMCDRFVVLNKLV
jgi:hypothetical protein